MGNDEINGKNNEKSETMTCDKEPINQNDILIHPHNLRCNKRKNHKGMCEMTYTIEWSGKKRE